MRVCVRVHMYMPVCAQVSLFAYACTCMPAHICVLLSMCACASIGIGMHAAYRRPRVNPSSCTQHFDFEDQQSHARTHTCYVVLAFLVLNKTRALLSDLNRLSFYTCTHIHTCNISIASFILNRHLWPDCSFTHARAHTLAISILRPSFSIEPLRYRMI